MREKSRISEENDKTQKVAKSKILKGQCHKL